MSIEVNPKEVISVLTVQRNVALDELAMALAAVETLKRRVQQLEEKLATPSDPT